MDQNSNVTDSQPYPAIVWVLSQKKLVCTGGGLMVSLIFFWIAFRIQFLDLAVIGVIAGLCTSQVLRLALEVVQIVADTLMPR